MLLSADLKKLEDHLGLLDEESREVARLTDSVAGLCLLAMDPSPLVSLIAKLDQEAERIIRRKQLLERVLADLKATNSYVENELDSSTNSIHIDQ